MLTFFNLSSWTPNQLLQVPEEDEAEPEELQNMSPLPQVSRVRRASQVPRKAIKVVKKVVLKKPQRRKGPRSNPQNRWVAFQSTTGLDGNEILSLSGGDNPQDFAYPEFNTRRKSFDDRRSSSGPSETDKATSRIQSMPNFNDYAQKDDVDIWAEEEFPEDQDNISTANLLLIYEGSEDDCIEPPEVIFTRASPCRSTDSRGKERKELGEQDHSEQQIAEQSETDVKNVDFKNVSDTKPEPEK